MMMVPIFRLVFILIIVMTLALTLQPGTTRAETPKVVASIKPLHGIVAALLHDIAKPGLIVTGTASHHGFRLTPSKARLLARATLVVWLGASGEPALAKAIGTLRHAKQTIAVLDLPGLQRLRRRDAIPGMHEHGNHHDHHATDDASRSWDSHIWLDPDNLIYIAEALTPRLIKLYPSQKDRLTANLAHFKRRMQILDQQIAAQLKPVRQVPFAVLHDAYQYFEHHYGLRNVSALLRVPGAPGSLRRINAFKKALRRSKVVCMFVEPQFSDRLARNIIAGSPIRIAVLDPLGATQPAGPDLPFEILRKLAANIRACLWPPP